MKHSLLPLIGVMAAWLAVGTSRTSEARAEQDGGTAPISAVPPTSSELAQLRDLEARPIHQMTNVDLADNLRLRAQASARDPNRPTPAESIGSFAQRALGQPYRLNAVQLDPAEGDCVSVVNRTLTLSLAADWPSYYKLTQRLMHKDGVVDYRNRNFSTLGDWVPNNSWLLEDVTPQLGPSANRPAQTFTFAVRPKIFQEVPAAPGSQYKRTIFKGSDLHSPNTQVRTGHYIPRKQIQDVIPDLRTGDIALCIRPADGGYMGCHHLGLIVRRPDGGASFIHCAPPTTRAIDLPQFLAFYTRVQGLMILRVRNDAAQAVATELQRLSTIEVPAPAQQDQKIEQLRAKRVPAQ